MKREELVPEPVASAPPTDPEPMAIVGMGCRFAPNLGTLDGFWEHLMAGRHSVREVPARRWEPYVSQSPQAAAKLRKATRFGAFMDDIEGFDAAFFDVSPREAVSVDPQQRVLLEVTWEAFEHAGIAPHTLRGTDAGVFMAANSGDYGRRLLEDIPRLEAWAINGGQFSGIANRISYALDLRGPSLVVDTACSGSLTALHLACQSLRGEECPIAVVGGVNIMAGPGLVVALDAANATSPDGRSKAFDQAADGYGRGEGAGVVLLKRLADARRDGDRILAVVRGSGVYQDGATEGMMLPNGTAQEHMLRQVYERAGISPATVDYVEAHGTGTPTGDRIEAQALARVFGAARTDGEPCLIGSVKSNIGHLEAGAGIAGVIKAVLTLRNGLIPPSPHTAPATSVDWAGSGLRLVADVTPWPRDGHPRRAGVSSYGMGGTTAHVVLEETPAGRETDADTAPVEAETTPVAARPQVFPLSSASAAGTRALAGKLADWTAEHPDVPLGAIQHTLTGRRSHLRHRAAVVATSHEELKARLRALAEEHRAPGTAMGETVERSPADPVWVFSGHGAQWAGMGRQLLAEEPVFEAVMDKLAPVFLEEIGFTPQQAIAEAAWENVARIQAMTFAIQVALAEVWRARGLRPGAIIGHSVGELSAATVAGALEFEEAARFACRRARVVQRGAGSGGMAMVSLSYEEVERELAGLTDVVPAIAASPMWTVVSGSDEALASAVGAWNMRGLIVRKVKTDVAFHSPLMDPLLADTGAAAADLTPHPPAVPLYTTVLDVPTSRADRDGEYWKTMLRGPVHFTGAVQAAIADGHRIFLEVSSHPIVTQSVNEILEHTGVDDAFTAYSLRRNQPESETLAINLAALHCHGAQVAWPSAERPGHLVDLPTMAWQHRPYWVPAPTTSTAGGGHRPDSHTLLGDRTTISGDLPYYLWQTRLDLETRPYPGRHPVHGVEIVPAAVLLNTLATAAREAPAHPLPALHDVDLRIPIAVGDPRAVQVLLHEGVARIATRLLPQEGGTPATEAGTDSDDGWTTHTLARVGGPTDGSGAPGSPDLTVIRARCTEYWPWERIEQMYQRRGVGGYGFDWSVASLHRGTGELIAELSVPPPPTKEPVSWPAVLDGALTLTPLLLPDDDVLRMPAHIREVTVHGTPTDRFVVYARLWPGRSHDTIDVHITDLEGRDIATVRGLRFGELQGTPGSATEPRHLAHQLDWRPLDPAGRSQAAPWEAVVLIGADDGSQPEITRALADSGIPWTSAATPQEAAALCARRPSVALVLPPVPGPSNLPEDAAADHAWLLIDTAQCLARATGHQTRLWCLTRGVRHCPDETALAQAPLWGAARIIAGEHGELWGGLIDLAPEVLADDPRLCPLLRTAGSDDVISLTADGSWVPRLTPIAQEPRHQSQRCRPDGTYLITGGLGALGLEVARWLVSQGARRLLLAGRHGLPPREHWDRPADATEQSRIEAVQALEALGATVRVLILDITDHDRAAAELSPAALGMPPIRGVVHAAGVVHDARVTQLGKEDLGQVLSPKARGAMVLHRLFPPGSLDFLVLFSSSGQYARPTGQVAYAAANSFLDALAVHRHKTGHSETLSLGWMAWSGLGMSEQITASMLEVNDHGIDAVSPLEAFRAWRFADRYALPYAAVLKPLGPRPGKDRLPVLTELAATIEERAATGSSEGFPEEWTSLTPEELRVHITGDLRLLTATELGMKVDELPTKRPLPDLGMDSVMTVALRIRIRRRYGIDLPPTILWNQPTITALAAHLVEQIAS